MKTCARRGCEARATHRIVPQYGRTFVVCHEHGTPWLEAIAFFDNRQSLGSTLERL